MQTAKEVRAACQEERRKVRELQEEERDLKKRHREEVTAAAAPAGGSGGKAASSATDVLGARRRQIDAAEKAMATRVRKAKAACEDAVARHENRLEQATRRLNTRCSLRCRC